MKILEKILSAIASSFVLAIASSFVLAVGGISLFWRFILAYIVIHFLFKWW